MKPGFPWSALLLAMLCPYGGASAAEEPMAHGESRRVWEAGVARESLTRGLPAWHSRYLNGRWSDDRSRQLFAGIRETERYALRDRELHLGGGLALGAATQLQLEVGSSDTHRVLAARYGTVQWQHQPGGGWSLGAGWRRSSYDNGVTGVVNLGIERYLGNERFAYTLYSGGPDGAGRAPAHRWQWDHYYGERNHVGLAVSHGRETEYSAGVFVTSRVSGVSLGGAHHLAPGWALVWQGGSVRQGALYTRSGISLGLRHAF